METGNRRTINRVFLGLIIIITTRSALQWMVMSQSLIEMDTLNSNEVFDDEATNDDTNSYSSFHMSPSSADTNTSFSKNNLSDKTTSRGLDITSPHMFQSKTIAQLYTVFPGTVWCGAGNVAGNNQILGYFAQTDSCCRTHDNCRFTITPGSVMFGLKNSGYFTRSHCSCDEKFYKCLKRANSIIANKVGYTYFNLLRPQCFRKDFPVVACLRWVDKRCKLYMVDESDDREWQWFDNRGF